MILSEPMIFKIRMIKGIPTEHDPGIWILYRKAPNSTDNCILQPLVSAVLEALDDATVTTILWVAEYDDFCTAGWLGRGRALCWIQAGKKLIIFNVLRCTENSI